MNTRSLCGFSAWFRARAGRMLMFLGVLLLASSCGRPAAAPPGPPLRIAIDLWAGYYPAVIAEQQGFFAAENVAVDLRVPQDTRRMMADFAAQTHDAICVSIGDMILLSHSQNDIRMILCSDESAGGDVIFGKTPVTGAADLRGRRFGTNLGGFGELFFRRMLRKYGVGPDEVQLLHVDASQALGQMQRGELDFAHTWEPYAAQMRSAGFTEAFSSRETPGLILDGLVIHNRILQERPREVRGFLRAWFRAVDWWNAHPAEGNALVEKRLKLEPGSVSLQGIRLMTLPDDRRLFASGTATGPLGSTLNEFVEFFVSRGLLNRRLTAEGFLDPQYLP